MHSITFLIRPASNMQTSAPSPTKLTPFFILMGNIWLFSEKEYVPARTYTVSPEFAATIANWIMLESSGTIMVLPSAVDASDTVKAT